MNKSIFDHSDLFQNLKNEKKLILTDSDDTLRKSDGMISDKTKEAIQKIKKIGNTFVICTGRPRYHTLNLMKEVGTNPICICSNGAEIYDSGNNKIIHAFYLNHEELLDLLELAFTLDIRIILSIEDKDYTTKVKNESQILLDKNHFKEQIHDKKIKTCTFIDHRKDLMNKIKNILSEKKTLKIINENRKEEENTFWFTIGDKHVSKGNAIKILREYLNIPKENVISIGNGFNDLSMFQESGISVAVENASSNIKEQATLVAPSNDEDGVYHLLKLIK